MGTAGAWLPLSGDPQSNKEENQDKVRKVRSTCPPQRRCSNRDKPAKVQSKQVHRPKIRPREAGLPRRRDPKKVRPPPRTLQSGAAQTLSETHESRGRPDPSQGPGSFGRLHCKSTHVLECAPWTARGTWYQLAVQSGQSLEKYGSETSHSRLIASGPDQWSYRGALLQLHRPNRENKSSTLITRLDYQVTSIKWNEIKETTLS